MRAPPINTAHISDFDEYREAQERLVQVIHGKIVGIQYYRGDCHVGEYVNLVREPNNRHDSNAICVQNMAGTQVGHVKATIAAWLAPIADDPHRLCRLEGTIIHPHRTQWDIPVQIGVYATPERFNWAKAMILRGKLHLLPPPVSSALSAPPTSFGGGYGAGYGAGRGGGYGGGHGFGGGQAARPPPPAALPAAPPPPPAVTTQVIDKARSQQELDALYADQQKVLETLTFDSPAALATRLLAHQMKGAAWMLQRERAAKALPPFFEARRAPSGAVLYFNTVTNSSVSAQPASLLGGILADDMGLGKRCARRTLSDRRPPHRVLPALVGAAERWRPDPARSLRLSLSHTHTLAPCPPRALPPGAPQHPDHRAHPRQPG